MRFLISLLLAISATLWLSACGDKPERKDSSIPKTEPDPPKKIVEEESLFAPINEEHAKNMREKTEEFAEIDRRVEEAAKKHEAAFLKEVEDQIATYRADYSKVYDEQIHSRVTTLESQLRDQYVANLKTAEPAMRRANRIVLADQLAQEIQLTESGEHPPPPPADSDQSNPGLKMLFDQRKWYYEGLANIQKAQRDSVAQLTEQYRLQLQQYYDFVKTASPPEAGQLVAKELERISGDWWVKSENPPTEQ